MAGDDVVSTDYLARLLKQCLHGGLSVEIERLGVFRASREGGFEFTPNSKPSVFIAYVEEDAQRAGDLFRSFKAAGFDPWMDRKKLVPGQNWPRAIERAIERADYFVACLSRRAVGKRGCFQSELRYALDCARTVPLGQIYFIPVRLDECEVPARIRKEWQYVDLFADFQGGALRVVQMIRNEEAKRRRGAS